MSHATTEPTKEEAQKLAAQLYGQHETAFYQNPFFGLLKQAGIIPRNQAEAQSLLTLGFTLERQEAENPQPKVAADRFAGLVSHAQGAGGEPTDDDFRKAANSMLVQDPHLLAVSQRVALMEQSATAN